jgi:hypothetical protein
VWLTYSGNSSKFNSHRHGPLFNPDFLYDGKSRIKARIVPADAPEKWAELVTKWRIGRIAQILPPDILDMIDSALTKALERPIAEFVEPNGNRSPWD